MDDERATFEFDDSQRNWPSATITYPNGRKQTVLRDGEARQDQPGFLSQGKNLRIYLFTQTHQQAKELQLDEDEWDYNAGGGELAGLVY